MFLNYCITPIFYNFSDLNRKHEMFLNVKRKNYIQAANKLNRKHEMFLNFLPSFITFYLHNLNRKHEMFLNSKHVLLY